MYWSYECVMNCILDEIYKWIVAITSLKYERVSYNTGSMNQKLCLDSEYYANHPLIMGKSVSLNIKYSLKSIKTCKIYINIFKKYALITS